MLPLYFVIACGVWSPRIAAMAGASIPLTPAASRKTAGVEMG